MERISRDSRVWNGTAAAAKADCNERAGGDEFASSDAANDGRMSRLARTIEHEIIPRLMLAHRTNGEPPVAPPLADSAIGVHDIHQFAKLVLSLDEDLASDAVQVFRQRGVSIEQIYLELLGPTARYLGDLWTEDLCSFTDMTVGLGRLQRVLRELSLSFGEAVDHPDHGRRVLLLPSPGEQHTFGLVMVAEFFRRAGWDVAGGAWAAGADAASLVSGEWFDAVGFSLGSQCHVGALAETVRAVRHAACNRNLVVLVGGPIVSLHPELVKPLGVDGMTVDGKDAPALAERLIVRTGVRH